MDMKFVAFFYDVEIIKIEKTRKILTFGGFNGRFGQKVNSKAVKSWPGNNKHQIRKI